MINVAPWARWLWASARIRSAGNLVERRVTDPKVLELLRRWIAVGVMEDGSIRENISGTPQGGVISPLLSNIYLSVFDTPWMRHSAPLGTLVRLELHPEEPRRVELYDGKEGFDLLGCYLRKRLSGHIWERERKRVYFLHRRPSKRSMKRVRQRVKELTPNAARALIR
jgi:retron-type reverse transcriptase